MSEPTMLRQTPLHAFHAEHGGRLVDFAGWELPIQYEGVIAEHNQCRTSAALFDVSHMGVVELRSPEGREAVAEAFERLTPAGITTLAPGRQRYALLTNDDGGVIDDCIVTADDDHLIVVVNAAYRDSDIAHFRQHLAGVDVIERTDLALLAVQGPRAVDALDRLARGRLTELVFLDFVRLSLDIDGDEIEAGVSRSGYTGEDGFELMVAAADADRLARAIVDQPEVAVAGLGARDTLRLEAGLALSGSDLDATTSPVEADLTWTMPKRRREDGLFPGADRITGELATGPSRRRVGLQPTGRRPVRAGTELRTEAGQPAGTVTSGGYGPTVEAPIAMGYVAAELATDGTTLVADVRGTDVAVVVAPLPFTPHKYHRGN